MRVLGPTVEAGRRRERVADAEFLSELTANAEQMEKPDGVGFVAEARSEKREDQRRARAPDYFALFALILYEMVPLRLPWGIGLKFECFLRSPILLSHHRRLKCSPPPVGEPIEERPDWRPVPRSFDVDRDDLGSSRRMRELEAPEDPVFKLDFPCQSPQFGLGHDMDSDSVIEHEQEETKVQLTGAERSGDGHARA